MANIELYYEDQWKLDDIYSVTSEHSNFPKENTKHRDIQREWRSQYGAGSGWGNFEIGSAKNKLYFKDSGSMARTATITVGTYDADILAAEIETQIEAVTPDDNFTVEYLESGTNKNKFKITNHTGNFELTCTSTTNAIWDVIGFSTAADLTGADNYTSNDGIRIHTEEYMRRDLGANTNIYGLFIAGHNIQSGANLRARGSSSAFGTWNVNVAMTISGNYAYYRWTSAQNYRYWEAYCEDKDNPDTYIKIGKIDLLLQPFVPVRNALIVGHSKQDNDPSLIKAAEGGQETSIQLPHFKTRSYKFNSKNESSDFEDMFVEVGSSKQLFIIEDPDDLPGSLYYARLSSPIQYNPLSVRDHWDISFNVREVR
jgi:hypothetical protein